MTKMEDDQKGQVPKLHLLQYSRFFISKSNLLFSEMVKIIAKWTENVYIDREKIETEIDPNNMVFLGYQS